jgi:DNA-binding PadR family transcriptional regulator
MKIRSNLRLIRYAILKKLAYERTGVPLGELKRELMLKGIVSSDGAFYANLKDLMMEEKIKIDEIGGEKIAYITDKGVKEFKEIDEFLRKVINE